MAGDGFRKQYVPGYSVPTADIGEAFDAGVGHGKQLYRNQALHAKVWRVRSPQNADRKYSCGAFRAEMDR